jgi:hypothetical protein
VTIFTISALRLRRVKYSAAQVALIGYQDYFYCLLMGQAVVLYGIDAFSLVICLPIVLGTSICDEIDLWVEACA